MAEGIDLKLNKGGFRSVMQGDGIHGVFAESVRGMLSAAESMTAEEVNYLGNIQVGKVSLHGMVATGDRHAQRSNAKHNTLRKAIDGGRV